MFRPAPLDAVVVAVAGGLVLGFLGGVAFDRRITEPVSFDQCVMDEMRGRPVHLMTFAIRLCRSRTDPQAWGTLPAAK